MSFLTALSPVRKNALICTAVLVGLLVASWMFVLSPRSDAIAAANAEVGVASAANDALRNTIANRRAQEAKLPQLRKVDKALSGRFPPTAEQAKMFGMITAAAGQAGLAPSAVSNLTVNPPINGLAGQATSARLPGVAASVSEVAAQQITMDVTGTPEQIRKMIRNLEQLPRAFQVMTLSLNNSVPAVAETQTGAVPQPALAETTTAAITGQMYLLPTLADPTAKSTPAKSGAKKSSTAKKSG